MNLLDYLATEFATFEEKPFNPVDSAVLSQFCMVRGDGIVPALPERRALAGLGGLGTFVQNLASPQKSQVHFTDLLRAERYADMFTGLAPNHVKENLLALAASPRFRAMTVRDYASIFDAQRQTQFAAMTFTQGKDFAYVGFRGTDSSITGWKENFNMAYTSPVPAQEQAVRYVEAVARRTPKRLIIGGHSKGGNLAEYAALKAPSAVQKRIERVYVHDGPGFKAGTFSEADYAPLLGKLHKTVPQDSVIGLLMESRAPLRVVHSVERGIQQHSLFTWEVVGDDFMYESGLTDNARMTAAVTKEWLARFDDEERARVVDAFFRTIQAAGAQDALDLLAGGPRAVTLLFEAARRTESDDRDVLLAAAKSFAEVVAAHVGRSVADILPKGR